MITPDLWCLKEGRKKLEEAMKRLNLDESRIRSKNLVNLGFDYLISEKAKVKTELKKYDTEFNDLFNRLPNKVEKEILRPLYMYYKNLKNAIDTKQAAEKKSGKQAGSSNPKEDISKYGQHKEEKEIIKKKDSGEQLKEYNSRESSKSGNSSNNYIRDNKVVNMREQKEQNNISNNSNLTNSPNNNSHSNIYSFNNVFGGVSNQRENRYETYDNDLKDMRLNSGISGKTNSANSSINYGIDMAKNIEKTNEREANNKRSNSHSYNEPKKIYSKQEVRELEKEYAYLLKEQSQLKDRLQKFQKEFQEINNRRIKFHKDILPVENEYQTYKFNRERVNELQAILTEIKLAKPK
jgi:hypothetical protein